MDTIIKAQQKLKNGMVYGSDDIQAAFQTLGVSLGYFTGKGGEVRVFRDAMDVFWDAGEALKNYGDEVERDAMAQKIFGRSWQELMPLFLAGRKEYEDTLAKQNVVSEDSVKKLNDLDDALQRLDQDYQATKQTLLATVAPAFTTVGNTVADVMEKVNAYLQTPEGQEKLEALREAAEELFDDLTDSEAIDAADVVGGALDSVKEALLWIKDNKDTVVTAIKAIGGAFLALKAAEVVGGLAQGAVALKNLLGGNSGGGVSAGAGKALQNAAQGAGGSDYTESWIDASLAMGAWFKRIGAAALTAVKNATPYAAFGATVIGAGNTIDAMGTKRYEEFEEQMNGIAEASAGASDAVREMYKTLDILGQAYKGDTNVREAFKMIDPETLRQVMPQSDLFNWLDNVYGGNWNAFLDDSSTSGTMLMEYAEEFATGFASALAALQDADKPNVEVVPEMAPDAASLLQEQANGLSVTIPAYPDLSSVSVDGTHANGLPFVPFDGYIAALHKGERVVPAIQNKSMTSNSNLYVEHMHMNNNTDVNGLASAIAERTRRTMSGFGS